MRLNFEMKCVNMEFPVTIRTRLETQQFLLLDRLTFFPLQVRNDGFGQALALPFAMDPKIPAAELDGKAALLTVEATDFDGVIVETKLRLVLTRTVLADLPEPDVQDVQPGEGGCVGCHRPVGSDGERVGIEDPHPWFALSCTDCHGG